MSRDQKVPAVVKSLSDMTFVELASLLRQQHAGLLEFEIAERLERLSDEAQPPTAAHMADCRPTYNHTRKDSPLHPCPLCAEAAKRYPRIHVKVHKAQRMVSTEPIHDLFMEATEEFPQLGGIGMSPTLEDSRALHVSDAQDVVAALYGSLPGGTLDQILRIMLERKASQFVVRF